MDAWAVSVVLAAALAAAVAQGLTGFGFALVALPILLFVVDVREAVVIASLLGTVSVGLVAARTWRSVAWPTMLRLQVGSVAGMPAGLLVLLLAPEEPLRIGVGVAIVVMTAGLAWGLRLPPAGTGMELAVGGISGVLRTSSSLAGPPVVYYLQARRFEPERFRATLVMFFLVGNLLALTGFFASGVVTGRALLYAALGLPAVFLGVAGGDRLLRRTDPRLFRRLVLALLIATALSGIALSAQRLVT